MRRWLIPLIAVAAGTGGGLWWWRWKASAVPPSKEFHLYFTCDTSGRIEPCGCFAGQMGGLTRITTVLKSAPAHSLILEVGDAIAGVDDYHIMQYRHLLRAFAHAGYAAVNLGGREARLPAHVLRELASNSPVPLLSANVLDAATHRPLVQPWLIVEKGGLRIGVTGVVDPSRLGGVSDPALELGGMAESLRAVLPEMKAKADVLVCLAFTDENGLEALAKDFYEVAVFLGGDVRQPSSGVAHVNQSHTFSTTNQGRALGELHGVVVPGNPTLTQVTGRIRLMEPSIAEDQAIAAHSAAYRKEVRTAALALDHPEAGGDDRVPGVKAPTTYAGCHPQAYAAWSKTSHAHAFDSLVARDSEADPSCISCHVTGFGEAGGYRRSMKAERLVHVSCESCHGPASAHVAVRASARPGDSVLVKMRAVGAGQCVQCHHGEFSRPFKFEEFWPKIAHGKE
jgi:hypothetical protein